MNGNLVGTWAFRSSDHSFTYEAEWLEKPFRRPISLSMPSIDPSTPYRGDVVANFFDNLLPDSNAVRTQLQRRLGTSSNEPLDLLEQLGGDCLRCSCYHGVCPAHNLTGSRACRSPRAR